VNQLERMIGVAVLAEGRLSNTAALNLDCNTIFANVTLKKCLSHFWDEIGSTNDHATDGNKLINI
jgi:hypothetical protein